MTYTTITCVVVHCDDCKQPLEWDDGFTLHHASVETAAEFGRTYGWVMADDVQLCENCADQRPDLPGRAVDPGPDLFASMTGPDLFASMAEQG